MPTISTYLKMMDQFSSPLRKTINQVNTAIVAMERLRRLVEAPAEFKVKVNASQAVAQVQQIANAVSSAASDVEIAVTLSSQGISQQMTQIEQQIRSHSPSVVINATVNSTEIAAQMQQLRQTISASGSAAVIEVAINAADVTQKIADIQSQIRNGLTASAVQVTLDGAAAVQEAAALRGRIDGALTPINITPQIHVDATAVRNQLRMQISGIGNINANVRLEPHMQINLAQLRNQLNSQLSGLSSHAPITVQIKLDTTRALLQATALRMQILSRIGTIVATVNLSSNLTTLLQELIHLVRELTAAVRNIPPPGGGGGGGGGGSGGRGGFGGMAGQLGALAGGYLGYQGGKALIGATIGGAMEQQQIIDTFSARQGDGALGEATYNAIVQQALDLRQDVDQALSGSMSFLSNTKDPEKLMQLNEMAMRLQKLNPAEGLEGAAFSMKELLSGDYVSIVERFGFNKATLKDSDALAAGKAGDMDGFIKGMDTLLNQQNMSKEAFMKMLDSPAAKWQGILSRFKNQLKQTGKDALKALEPLFDMLEQAFKEGKFQPFFDTIKLGLAGFAAAARIVIPFIIDHAKTLQNVLLAIGVVAAAVAVIFLIDWAIAAWPILLIILALVGVLEVLNYLGISTPEIIAGIAGYFNFLGVYLQNVFTYIKNGWTILGDFIHNFMIDPVAAVKLLFFNLGSNFLGFMITWAEGAEKFADSFVKSVGGAINKILGAVGVLAGKLGEIPGLESLKGFQTITVDTDSPSGVSDFLKKLKSSYENEAAKIVADNPALQQTPLEQYKNGSEYYDAFMEGYNAVMAAFGDADNLVGDAKAIYDKIKGQLENGNGSNNIDKVGKVGKIEDSVDITSEDLKTMRELAEMKNIQNFVTLTPIVQVSGDNHFSQDVDMSGFITKLTGGLEKEVAASAKGVYA